MIKFIIKEKSELESFVSDRMLEIIKEKQNPLFILTTGNSSVKVYKKLIKNYNNGLALYNIDEYREIDKFSQDSFRKFMNDYLFDHINKDLDKLDNFDFTLFGVGTNGWITFNELRTPFNIRTSKIKLIPSKIKSNFSKRTEYPTSTITMGSYDIYIMSNEIILLAWGEDKRVTLEKLKVGVKADDYPITHFIDCPNMTIVTELKGFE